MSTEGKTWFGDIRPGELLDIGGGSVKLRIEEKSGQRARIRLEFTKPTTVTRVEPAMAAFARQGLK